MEKILIPNLKEMTLRSVANGELLHSVYVSLVYPGNANCRSEEIYHRFHVETIPRTEYYIFMHISNELRRIKRSFIRPERLIDPLVPRFREGLSLGSFSAVADGVAHLPLELLPGDILFLAIHAKQPFELLLRREW